MMNQSGRVWKWTGAVLAFLCAGLGACHCLLTYLDQPVSFTPTVTESIRPLASPNVDLAALERAPSDTSNIDLTARPATETSLSKATPDSRLAISNQRESGEATHGSTANPNLAASVKSREPQPNDSPNSATIDNRQSSIVDSVRPLGIVEKADGRLQAVIADGEWTRLVEGGEVLADHSRVVKVSAESVEILRPKSDLNVELARTGGAAQTEAKPEVASADGKILAPEAPRESTAYAERAQANTHSPLPRRANSGDDLPGMEAGEASYHALPAKPSPAAVPRDEMRVKESPRPLARPAPARGLESSSSDQGILGEVEYSNGEIRTVMGEGSWVRLVPHVEASDQKSDLAGNISSPSELPTPGALGSVSAPSVAPAAILDSGSPIPNSGDPIGIVEWSDGRTQAIVALGPSVEFVNGAEAVAEVRRALVLTSAPETPPGVPELTSTVISIRQREDEAAKLAMAEDESDTRGPPGEEEAALVVREEIARGQPGDDGIIDMPRSPPANPFEDLPGINDLGAARIEPFGVVEPATEAILSQSAGEEFQSVSISRPSDNENGLSIASPSMPDLSPILAAPKDRSVKERSEVLGVVCPLEGPARAIVSVGGSIILMAEGDTLPDGRRVSRVDREGATFSAESLGTAARSISTDHPSVAEAHQSQEELSGSRLQTEPSLRDNLKEGSR